MKTNHSARSLDTSVLHLLHRAGQQAEIMFMKEVDAETDLTPRQYAVLLAVAQNEDISQTGLVTTTGIDRSTLADVVRRLVERGFLQRRRTRADARMYAVRISAKGRQVLDAAHPAASRADDSITSMLSARQRSDLIETLAEIVRSLDQIAAAALNKTPWNIGPSALAPNGRVRALFGGAALRKTLANPDGKRLPTLIDACLMQWASRSNRPALASWNASCTVPVGRLACR